MKRSHSVERCRDTSLFSLLPLTLRASQQRKLLLLDAYFNRYAAAMCSRYRQMYCSWREISSWRGNKTPSFASDIVLSNAWGPPTPPPVTLCGYMQNNKNTHSCSCVCGGGARINIAFPASQLIKYQTWTLYSKHPFEERFCHLDKMWNGCSQKMNTHTHTHNLLTLRTFWK